MKNFKNLLILPAIALGLLSSCNSSLSIVKRKYNDGYYVSASHHANKIEVKEEASKTIDQETAKDIKADDQAATDIVITQNAENIAASTEASAVATASADAKEMAPAQKSGMKRKSVSKKNTAVPEILPIVLKKKGSQMAQKMVPQEHTFKAADQILEIILAIFLPPIAVLVHNNGLSTEFWLDLLLTLLFFIPGVIYALIIVLR